MDGTCCEKLRPILICFIRAPIPLGVTLILHEVVGVFTYVAHEITLVQQEARTAIDAIREVVHLVDVATGDTFAGKYLPLPQNSYASSLLFANSRCAFVVVKALKVAMIQGYMPSSKTMCLANAALNQILY